MGPVAVGGVGGSGTRVIAGFLQALGVYIGDELNPPLDNRWFTLLFKRRSWATKRPSNTSVGAAASAFRSAMLAEPLDGPGLRTVAQATIECSLRGHNVKGSGRGLRALQVGGTLVAATRRPTLRGRWGWKEPNTHVFLPELADAFPGLRYIHVLRDGVEMSQSRNWDQAALWAPRYGLPVTRGSQLPPTPAAKFSYWVRANEVAIAEAERSLPGRYFLLRFEELCSRPRLVLESLARWVDLEMTPAAESVLKSVRMSTRETTERSWAEMVDQLDPSDISGLGRLGYSPPL